MRIHHFTIPARNPERVASVLAELFGARVMPMPHPQGCLLVHAGDADGSAIEVWPEGLRGLPGDRELTLHDLPLPTGWPHHAYLTSDTSDPERVLAVFAREGWRAERVHNGPPGAGFSLVRGWIENQSPIEIGDSQMRAEYERTSAALVQRAAGRSGA